MPDIVLNEQALGNLLHGDKGVVAGTVRLYAQSVVGNAQQGVQKIMWKSKKDVSNDVKFEMIEHNGEISAVIGIVNTGERTASKTGHVKDTIAEYLAKKEQREGGAWLLPALQMTFLNPPLPSQTQIAGMPWPALPLEEL